MTVLMEVDGAVYLPAGQTITGLPIVVAEETNKLVRWAISIAPAHRESPGTGGLTPEGPLTMPLRHLL